MAGYTMNIFIDSHKHVIITVSITVIEAVSITVLRIRHKHVIITVNLGNVNMR